MLRRLFVCLGGGDYAARKKVRLLVIILKKSIKVLSIFCRKDWSGRPAFCIGCSRENEKENIWKIV